MSILQLFYALTFQKLSRISRKPACQTDNLYHNRLNISFETALARKRPMRGTLSKTHGTCAKLFRDSCHVWLRNKMFCCKMLEMFIRTLHDCPSQMKFSQCRNITIYSVKYFLATTITRTNKPHMACCWKVNWAINFIIHRTFIYFWKDELKYTKIWKWIYVKLWWLIISNF